jgi:hypothetical protein
LKKHDLYCEVCFSGFFLPAVLWPFSESMLLLSAHYSDSKFDRQSTPIDYNHDSITVSNAAAQAPPCPLPAANPLPVHKQNIPIPEPIPVYCGI